MAVVLAAVQGIVGQASGSKRAKAGLRAK
jgi:hypothetical protein